MPFSALKNRIKSILEPRARLEPSSPPDAAPASKNSQVAKLHLVQASRLRAEGRLDEAIACCERALAAEPEYVDAFRALSTLFWQTGRTLEAAASCYMVTCLTPDDADAHYNLGHCLLALGKIDDAIASLKTALSLKPGSVVALTRLGWAYKSQDKIAEAVDCWRQAAAQGSEDSGAIALLAMQNRIHCDWRNYQAEQAAVLKSIRSGSGSVPPFVALHLDTTLQDQMLVVKSVLRDIDRARPQFVRRSAERHEKIRLGYISSDFRRHATAYLTAEMFEIHDRSRFEVVGYSMGPDDRSDIRKRLIRAFDRFVDLDAGSIPDPAKQIYDDGIDILIDLKGHTADNCMRILARRAAPIQVHYLGYPGTTGATFIDYLIADRIVVPPDQQKFYSEKLVYLPDSYQVNDRRRPIARAVPRRAQCGLPVDGFVFCCFNGPQKITPAFFDIWMRLLNTVPDSVLWLYEGNEMVAGNLRREAQARGVDGNRLVFGPKLPLDQHLARYSLADLFLDTLPCNAHTTMSDALWAGLPALTCVGDTFAGKVGASLLHAVGLPELITSSLPEYEARAQALAAAPAELAMLRKRLAQVRATAPLFDTVRFTRNIENAYVQMWDLRCAGKKPRQIIVTPDEGEG